MKSQPKTRKVTWLQVAFGYLACLLGSHRFTEISREPSHYQKGQYFVQKICTRKHCTILHSEYMHSSIKNPSATTGNKIDFSNLVNGLLFIVAVVLSAIFLYYV